MTALLDKPEMVAVAALLRQFRDGSAVPMRRPSYNAPTYLSKPITSALTAGVGPSATWQTFLAYSAPVSFIGVVSGYVMSTVEPITSPGVEFRICVDDNLKLSIAPGLDPCRLASSPWPRRQRSTRIYVNEASTVQVQCRNLGAVPRTAILALYGWAYDTINIYPEESGSMGITDA